MCLSLHSTTTATATTTTSTTMAMVCDGNTCENICCNIETYTKLLLMAQRIHTTMEQNYKNKTTTIESNKKKDATSYM